MALSALLPRSSSRPVRTTPRVRGDRAGRPSGRPAYTVVQLTQHWRKIENAWYRDVVVLRADGTPALFAIREESAA